MNYKERNKGTVGNDGNPETGAGETPNEWENHSNMAVDHKIISREYLFFAQVLKIEGVAVVGKKTEFFIHFLSENLCL